MKTEIELKAIDFGNDNKKILARLKFSISCFCDKELRNLKNWRYEAMNKRMIYKDNNTILQWKIRNRPDREIDYYNQQTSQGTVNIEIIKN